MRSSGQLFRRVYIMSSLLHTHTHTHCRAKWVKVHGTKYQTPCALVVGRSQDDELQFGHVTNIFVHCQQVYFEFELMHAEFCKHIHAYALSLPPTSLRQQYLVEHRYLPTYHPYGLYHCQHLNSDLLVQFTVLRNDITF